MKFLAIVINLPFGGIAVINAGLKSITHEFGLSVVKGSTDLKVMKFTEEHTRLLVENSNYDLRLVKILI